MGSLRLTLCTGVLTVAAFAPTAYAADGEGVSVTPAAPVPGADVTLEVAECTGRTAVAVSPAFVSDVRLTVADGVLVGESRVRSSLTAGTYDVKVDCGGTERTGTLEVASAPSGRPDASAGRPDASAVPVTPASPVAPVDAGGGATARMAAGTPREDGPGTAQTVIGLALVGAAAVAVVHDRVRRNDGTG
ncbi:hypothetical protein SUDANB176_02804 [Streptomyces sp. enrichment culture]|uniref:hypothetical protein n=1 Tax=Streptomyces sp. enrichment culture TaxID=1795815 RepID=UPI003F5513B7